MATAEELKGYANRAQELVEEWKTVDVNNAAEAKTALAKWRVDQKELGWIKAQINLHIKGLRNTGAAEAVSAAEKKPGLLTRLTESRGDAVKRKADARRNVKAAYDQEVQRHEKFKVLIDQLMIAMDKVKLQLEDFIAKQ